MARFIACGELESTKGGGFFPPLIIEKIKSGVYVGNFILTNEFIEFGKINFPVEIKEITGSLDCYDVGLISLEGSPKKIGGDFWCGANKLTTLKGAPKEVGGDFMCFDNKLTSLEGCPDKIRGKFDCSYNQLTSLEGCPKYVGGDFDIRNDTKQFTEEEVRAVCDVKGKVFV
ncbi:MAG TPA: hypothetical protein PK151_04400 [Caldisericia bacterium]|nr:hypothetical protein [Caldisericia bacterium]